MRNDEDKSINLEFLMFEDDEAQREDFNFKNDDGGDEESVSDF